MVCRAEVKREMFSSLLFQLPTQQCSLQAAAAPQCEGKDHKNHTNQPQRGLEGTEYQTKQDFFFTLNHNCFKDRRYQGHPLWVATLPLTRLLPQLCASVTAYGAIGRIREQLNMLTASRVQMSGSISDSVLDPSQPEDWKVSVHLLPGLNSFLMILDTQRDDCVCPLCALHNLQPNILPED